jgi:hypothetical protein
MTVKAESAATELRESMMAVTRQMRRHRPDHGLTLSQMEVLGEVSRTGVSTPAELAARLHGILSRDARTPTTAVASSSRSPRAESRSSTTIEPSATRG